MIVHGDGCEIRTMSEIGMGRANVVVAVTGDDEDNLVICQMAKRKFGVPRTIARVNDPKNEELFKELGIDQTVSSTRIIFNLLEQQIETGQVIPLAALKKGEIEVVEANITPGSAVAGLKIGQIDLPLNTLIISRHSRRPRDDPTLRHQAPRGRQRDRYDKGRARKGTPRRVRVGLAAIQKPTPGWKPIRASSRPQSSCRAAIKTTCPEGSWP